MDKLIEVKQNRLKSQMLRISIDALRAMASMQSRPLPFLTTIAAPTAIVGQVRYHKSMSDGLSTIYDPVHTAKYYTNCGVSAISVFTDCVAEHDGYIDMTLVNDALRFSKTPVISQDFVLHEYNIVEARAAGASVVMLSAGLVSMEKLRMLTSSVHRNRMTAVVNVYNEAQLHEVLEWSPQVIGLSSADPYDFTVNLELVEQLRRKIPLRSCVMLTHPLQTLSDVQYALNIGVNAMSVNEQLIEDIQTSDQLYTLLKSV